MKSQKDLASFSDEHLNYEIGMLWHAACVLNSIRKHPKEYQLSLMLRNTYLDSFAIHARVLYDFFYPKPAELLKHDDITASDYVANWQPLAKSQMMTAIPQKANKQVAHLTYERVAYEESGKGWDYLGLLNEFVDLLLHFGGSAKAGYLGPEIQKLISGLTHKQIQLYKATPILEDGVRQTGLTIVNDHFAKFA